MADDSRPSGLSRIADLLATDGRFSSLQVTRPHARLLMVRRGERFVMLAPAQVWDDEPALLAPTLDKSADGHAAIVLLGRPRAPDLAALMGRGVTSLVAVEVDGDGLFLAVFGAFELLETRGRAESRGKWLQRYRYELGELIEIARALTTEHDLEKLLGLILEKARFI
ncbi:MAG: hypothetical protein ACHREM_25210, partial [Polyangiales bacterium]